MGGGGSLRWPEMSIFGGGVRVLPARDSDGLAARFVEETRGKSRGGHRLYSHGNAARIHSLKRAESGGEDHGRFQMGMNR